MRCSKCNSDNVFVKKGKCFCFECFDFTEVNPSDKLDDYVNKREINADYFQVNMPRLQSELNKFADFELSDTKQHDMVYIRNIDYYNMQKEIKN